MTFRSSCTYSIYFVCFYDCTSSKEFRINHMEIIKGIQWHGYYDELVVPTIENTAHDRELTEFLAAAFIEMSGVCAASDIYSVGQESSNIRNAGFDPKTFRVDPYGNVLGRIDCIKFHPLSCGLGKN
ncbi:hypothetical protein L1987_51519 [Smallanthus sonchifolius]|uniref:Uncharacterized protein n=1 Tax=Smallanthus sonchifolius TaxID=185202 RepID=A0ACB9ERN5_9ASTR|nr:hypothetical protein L1987_51519 [Smallanthus sonchifolius]